MSINKIIGYVLLAMGLMVIGFTLYWSFLIFQGKVNPPDLFQAPFIPTSSKKTSAINGLQDLQAELTNQIQEQIGQTLPHDALPKTLNLLSWSLLASIMILGGSQLSGLGIKLVKD